MQNHWDLGRWGKLPITLHWTVLMVFPWLYIWMQDVVGAVVGSLAYLVLLVVHEYGHVLAARLRKVPVYGINFVGWHGETARAPARSLKDDVFIAWSGVLAQGVLLAFAVAAPVFLPPVESPWLARILGPALLIWTKWNVFLMIVALLPIGPMDGHAAWKIFRLVRNAFRRKPAAQTSYVNVKVVPLSAARRRALEEDSAQKVVEILERYRRN